MKKYFLIPLDVLATPLALLFITWIAHAIRLPNLNVPMVRGDLFLILILPGIISALYIVLRVTLTNQYFILGPYYKDYKSVTYENYTIRSEAARGGSFRIFIAVILTFSVIIGSGYALSYVADYYNFFSSGGPIDRFHL